MPRINAQSTAPRRQWLPCPHCGSKELFYKPQINHRLHLILVVCTAGLWLVSYISLLIGQYFQPWLCTNCNHPQDPNTLNSSAGAAPRQQPSET